MPNNADKYATVVRYLITMFAAPFAARYITDPAVLQSFTDAAIAVALGLLTIGPMIYNLATRPSSDAMKVAEAADKVLGTGATQVTVPTTEGKPDLMVKQK